MKHDLPVTAVDVRAIDVGYFNTKYTLGRERDSQQTIKVATFTSLAPIVASTQMTGATGTAQSKAWLIGVKNVDYLVGPGAASQASGLAPRPVDVDYSETDKYYALMLGALNHMAEEEQAGTEFTVRCLVLGLPLTSYMKHAARLAAQMRGTHSIGPSAGPVVRNVTVEQVKVVVQPHGAMTQYGAGDPASMSGLNVVVDPGGGTLDWFVSKGMEPNWARTGSYPKAMLHCALAVANSIKSTWATQVDVMEAIDLALRNGAETFMVGTREYRMKDYRPAVDAVLEESTKTLMDKTGPLDNARRILFVGGGAPLFHEYMARRYPDLKPAMALGFQPVFANLRGFQITGEVQTRTRLR